MKHFFIFHCLALHFSRRISKGNPAVAAASGFFFFQKPPQCFGLWNQIFSTAVEQSFKIFKFHRQTWNLNTLAQKHVCLDVSVYFERKSCWHSVGTLGARWIPAGIMKNNNKKPHEVCYCWGLGLEQEKNKGWGDLWHFILEMFTSILEIQIEKLISKCWLHP